MIGWVCGLFGGDEVVEVLEKAAPNGVAEVKEEEVEEGCDERRDNPKAWLCVEK